MGRTKVKTVFMSNKFKISASTSVNFIIYSHFSVHQIAFKYHNIRVDVVRENKTKQNKIVRLSSSKVSNVLERKTGWRRHKALPGRKKKSITKLFAFAVVIAALSTTLFYLDIFCFVLLWTQLYRSFSSSRRICMWRTSVVQLLAVKTKWICI